MASLSNLRALYIIQVKEGEGLSCFEEGA